MAPTTPSQTTLTLRLKYKKSTTILHVDPLQSFESVAIELLRALHQTHPNGLLLGNVEIPTDAQEVLLAKANDIYDVSKGWTQLQTAEEPEETEPEAKSAKGAPPKKRKREKSISEFCPKAAGWEFYWHAGTRRVQESISR